MFHRPRVGISAAATATALLLCTVAQSTAAQGLSSAVAGTEPQPLYPRQELRPGVAATPERLLSPSIEGVALYSVGRPEPQTYALHDLVTILIREDLNTNFEAAMETERSIDRTGDLAALPRIDLRSFVRGNGLIDGSTVEPPVNLDLRYESEFEGEGDYSRRESMTARLTARVIDVKPNGTLVLEARKKIEADDESVLLVATGVCRVDDIAADNTILSQHLYDLHISKQHAGELRRSTKKGLLTRVMDLVFNF